MTEPGGKPGLFMLPLSSAQIISSMGSNIIRTFDWRHVALLARVRDLGLCLDSQLAFTRGAHALQNALLDPFIRGKSAITLVSRNGDIEAVGQCIYRSDAPNARLSFFGPAEALDSDAGLKLLESLAAAVGEHGAPNLIAEVDERSDAFERLRSAGFAIYARQRIWRLVEAKEDFEPAESDNWRFETVESDIWRVEKTEDKIAAQSLYHNIVPGLVQQVEPPPTRPGHNLVYWREGELLGYLDVERGSLGTWIQPYFHPAVEGFQGLLGAHLKQVRGDRPVYVCVRSYQSWMSRPLERLWFEPAVDQAVMVKRLAIGVRSQVASPLPAVEGTYPEPTAPIARIEDPAGASK